MITPTPYNTRWWGAPFGRITEAAFFDQSAADIAAQLAAYDVVEWAGSDPGPDQAARLRGAGFWRADSQIRFKIGLRGFAGDAPTHMAPTHMTRAHMARLRAVSAAERPFAIAPEDLPRFGAERFWQLAGNSEVKMAARYAHWSADLIAANPDHCMEVFEGETSIGWFLGRSVSASTVELTLAMARPGARAMGAVLYEAALRAYGSQGARLGQAAFSVSNSDVMNIYAGLGARFMAPTHQWLWQS